MKKILTSVFLGIALLLLAPQTIHAASTPFTFTAKMTQPSEGMTVKTGSTFYIFVKVAPPESGTGFKTSFIVSWPDGSSQVISSANLDLDASKVINGPVGNRPVSVFAVMTQAGNSYVATQTLTGKVNVVSGPLAITSSLPATNATLKSGAARSFSVQVAGGQAPYKVTWVFPDGKSASVATNAQGLATTAWTPAGQGGKKLVMIAVTDQTKKVVLQNQYVIVNTVTSPAKFHEADTNKNYIIEPSELSAAINLYRSTGQSTKMSRVIQFYNAGGYTVKAGTEDGFAPVAKKTSTRAGLSNFFSNSLKSLDFLAAAVIGLLK